MLIFKILLFQKQQQLIYYQVYIMNRTNSRPKTNTINKSLIKVNQIINSIFTLNQPTLLNQLQTCSKIVSQLLQNQLINHLTSIGPVRLLCYKLVLFIVELNGGQNRTKLSVIENTFGNNQRIIKMPGQLRNILGSLQEILQQMIYRNTQINRGIYQKKTIQNQPLYQGYVQFKNLLQDLDNHPYQTQPYKDYIKCKQTNKKTAHKNQSDNEQNEALIEQLQQIISKKQRRIKQLNEQLQQYIVQQKAQQDLISQLQSRNITLMQQIKTLNYKLSQKDTNQISLQQQIENLKTQIVIKQKQLTAKKSNMKTQKTLITRFTLDDEQSIVNKRQFKDLFDNKSQVCPICEQKKDISIEDVNNFRRLLLVQAVSIQAMI